MLFYLYELKTLNIIFFYLMYGTSNICDGTGWWNGKLYFILGVHQDKLKAWKKLKILPLIPYLLSFCKRMAWLTESKALARSVFCFMDSAPCSFSPFICAFGNKPTAGGQPLVLFYFMYFTTITFHFYRQENKTEKQWVKVAEDQIKSLVSMQAISTTLCPSLKDKPVVSVSKKISFIFINYNQ